MSTVFELYNSNIHTHFILNEISKGVFNIKKGNLFLSIKPDDNCVDLYTKDEGNNRQRWTIETDEDNFSYIKTLYKREDKASYLGSPNLDRTVYLYSSKNRFTRWKLEQTNPETNEYRIQYAGETFDPKDITIVVARYKENIQWTKPYSDICKIYNKGPHLEGYKNYFEVSNIGRESHTYLYHIIQNYDTLSRWNLFLQGDPFPHNETLIFGLDNYEKFKGDVQSLSLQYMKRLNIPPEKYINDHKTVTDYGFEYAVYDVDNNLRDIPGFNDKGVEKIIENVRLEYTDMLSKTVSIFERLLRESKFPLPFGIGEFPKTVKMCYSALFGVTGERIIKLKKEVYERLLKDLTRKNLQGGSNGYVLERLWLYIFGYEE